LQAVIQAYVEAEQSDARPSSRLIFPLICRGGVHIYAKDTYLDPEPPDTVLNAALINGIPAQTPAVELDTAKLLLISKETVYALQVPPSPDTNFAFCHDCQKTMEEEIHQENEKQVNRQWPCSPTVDKNHWEIFRNMLR